MSQVEADVRLVPVADLHQSPDNPRRISERDFERLRKSIRDDPAFMSMRPVLARPDGSVYAGNMRLEAAKAEGWTEVPTIVTDDPEAVIRQRAIKDNASYGEWIAEDLAEYLSGLGDLAPEFDLDALAIPDDLVRQMGMEADAGLLDATQGINAGFGASDLAERAADGAPGHPNFRDDDTTLEGVPEALPGAFQLTPELNYEKGLNTWDIPVLRDDMLVETLPSPMMCWSDQKTTPPQDDRFYLWNYGLSPAAGLPADRALMCFYTYDHYFENWWSLPHYYTTKALNLGIAMSVVPDFSIYGDMARVLRMVQVYRAQWLGRYFQEAGIKVIPRLNPGPAEDWDWSMLGIPEGVPVAATCFQTNFSPTRDDTGEATDPEALRRYTHDGFVAALETVKPQSLLNYGGPPAHRFVDEVLLEVGLRIPVLHVLNYSGVRRGVAYDKGAAHTDSPRDDNPNVSLDAAAVPTYPGGGQ